MRGKVLKTASVAFCLIVSLLIFAGCNDEPDDTRSVETEETTAAESAVDFTGTWKLAAAESEGVTMAGNFGEIAGIDDVGQIVIKEDGTGEIKLGDDSVSFKWEQKGDDRITLTSDDDNEYIGESADVICKDDALFMEMKQDGKTARGIFTRDGSYAEARVFDMDDAKAITSEDELLGTWKMTGLKMAGISVYGDPDNLTEMNSGIDSSVTFKEGGVATMNTGDGTWKLDDDGATLTATDITGTHDYTVKRLDDDIVIDMSQILGGTEFITVLSKEQTE